MQATIWNEQQIIKLKKSLLHKREGITKKAVQHTRLELQAKNKEQSRNCSKSNQKLFRVKWQERTVL